MSEWNIFQLIAMGFNVFAGFCFFTAASRLNKTNKELVLERYKYINKCESLDAYKNTLERRNHSNPTRLAP